ncbi:MAG: DegV family protein [Clostridia bacterium]
MLRIITDSAADFEAHQIERNKIEIIPLSIIFGDEEYKENINITKDEFYEKLMNNPNHPTTSQPTVEDFLTVFEDAKEKGDEILGLFISSKLSGTFQGAMLAAKLSEIDEDKFYFVDTLSATCGERVLVDYAVKLRDEGKSLREIGKEIDRIKEKLNIYAAVDTLEYLKRGGRISATAAAIGSLANLKPIIHVGNEGIVETTAKAMGVKKALSTILKQLEDKKPSKDMPMYLVYSYDKTNVLLLKESLEKLGYEIDEDRITPIGAAIGTHVGPGAFGVVYIAE